MSNRGGKRVGSGRKKGSTSSVRPKIVDFVTKKEVRELVRVAKTQAKEGKPDLLKFLLEQIFGRAPQGIDLTSGGEKIEPVPIYGGLSAPVSRHNSNPKNLLS